MSHKHLKQSFRILDEPQDKPVEPKTDNLNEDSVEEIQQEDIDKKPEDDRSTFTYVTEASTVVNAPLSYVTTTSSKLELQLDYLAKELELEK